MQRLMLGLRVLLVLAVVVSTQGLLLVQGTFLLRQDYVASMLCVDRFNPESDCNGTCYLKEQMARHHGASHSEDGHGKSPAMLELALTVRAMLPPGEAVEAPAYASTDAIRPTDDREPGQRFVPGVFHPPRIG